MCKSGASNGAFTVAARSICRIVLGFVLDRAFARTRRWLKNPDFPRIIDAWKLSCAQLHTQKLGCRALGDAATARKRIATTMTLPCCGRAKTPKGERRKSYIMMAFSLRMRRAASSLFHPLPVVDLEVRPPLQRKIVRRLPILMEIVRL